MLSAVAYNGEWRQLYLKFRSGDIYCYRNVPVAIDVPAAEFQVELPPLAVVCNGGQHLRLHTHPVHGRLLLPLFSQRHAFLAAPGLPTFKMGSSNAYVKEIQAAARRFPELPFDVRHCRSELVATGRR